MKLTLAFSASGSRSSVSHFDLPDTARQLPNFNDHIRSLSYLIGKLTHAGLAVTCYEADLWNYRIQDEAPYGLLAPSLERYLLLRFERYNGTRMERKHLRIMCPIVCPIPFSAPSVKHLSYNRIERFLLHLDRVVVETSEQQGYVQLITQVAETTLVLLNSEPPLRGHSWVLEGFHPNWLNRLDATGAKHAGLGLVTEDGQEAPTNASDTRSLHDLELAVEGTKETPLARPKRKTGPVPGLFRGILLRSQTEIRFAAQLEQRGFRWIYEFERLGAEQYLVDFYLPDLRIWVEVKSSMDARDEYQLPAVAAYLHQERNERLFVHTPRETYRVTQAGFSVLSHRHFWEAIAHTAEA